MSSRDESEPFVDATRDDNGQDLECVTRAVQAAAKLSEIEGDASKVADAWVVPAEVPQGSPAELVNASCVHSSEDGSRHYFASRVRRFLSMSALGVSDYAAYLDDFQRRQGELITSLCKSGTDRRSFEFRLVSYPDAKVPERGRVDVFVVCRVDYEPIGQVEAFAQQLKSMFASNFPEYEFEQASSAEVAELLTPFPVSQAVGIRRRVGWEPLDTISVRARPAWNVSYDLDEEDSNKVLPGTPEGSVLHVYPFISSRAPLHNLFRLLLLEGKAYAISVKLQPTVLTLDEIAFLESSVAVCERYAQVSLGAIDGNDFGSASPTLKEKAASQQRHLSRLLLGLRDNATLLTVTVASAGVISPFVTSALGSILTQPVGGTRSEAGQGLSSFLAGGYNVFAIDAGIAEATLGALDLVTPEQLLFPRECQRLPYLFDSTEAATSIFLPPVATEFLPGVETRGWKRAFAPRNLAETGVLLGETVETGVPRQVRLSPDDRLRHLYAIGQTGTGKSTLLKKMILDDIDSGSGVCVLDPHGDLYKDLIGRIPESRIKDVILIDPTDVDFPVGLNLLEVLDESQRHFVVQELTAIITRMLRDIFSDAIFSMTGPMFFQHVRMNLLLVMSDPDNPGTLMDFYTIFQETDYWKKWTPLKIADPMLQNWVDNVLPNMDYTKQTSDGPQWGSYINSKFEGFLFDPMLRSIFAQARSTVDFKNAMDTGKIVLVNLAKGELSEANSSFLGMVILAMVQAAAMGRSRTAHSNRRPFYLYVDEFQNVATENFVTLASEGRKFGVALILANQFISQVHNQKIMDSIFGNVGTLVSFRLGDTDADRLEKEMGPNLTRHDLLDIPNWHAYVSTLVNNQTVRPFEMRTILDQTLFDADRASAVRAASRDACGTPVFVDSASDITEETCPQQNQEQSGRVNIVAGVLQIPGLPPKITRTDVSKDAASFSDILDAIPTDRRIEIPRVLTVSSVDEFTAELTPLQMTGDDILCIFDSACTSFAAAIGLFKALSRGPSRVIAWVPSDSDPLVTLALQSCAIRVGGALAQLRVPYDFSYEARMWVFPDTDEDRYVKRQRAAFREHQVRAKKDREAAIRILLRRSDKTRAEIIELISEPNTLDGAEAVSWGLLDVALNIGDDVGDLAASSGVAEPVPG